MELHLQCHYNIKKVGDTYEFFISNGNLYKVYFENTSNTLFQGTKHHGKIKNIYTLTLIKVDKIVEVTKNNDYSIKEIVICLLKQFFEETENILFYICDSTDGRQLARHKLFSKWFNYENIPYLIKLDFIHPSDNKEKQYVTIINHSENKSKEYLLESIEEVKESIK